MISGLHQKPVGYEREKEGPRDPKVTRLLKLHLRWIQEASVWICPGPTISTILIYSQIQALGCMVFDSDTENQSLKNCFLAKGCWHYFTTFRNFGQWARQEAGREQLPISGPGAGLVTLVPHQNHRDAFRSVHACVPPFIPIPYPPETMAVFLRSQVILTRSQDWEATEQGHVGQSPSDTAESTSLPPDSFSLNPQLHCWTVS